MPSASIATSAALLVRALAAYPCDRPAARRDTENEHLHLARGGRGAVGSAERRLVGRGGVVAARHALAARQRARAIEPEKVRPGVVALAALAASCLLSGLSELDLRLARGGRGAVGSAERRLVGRGGVVAARHALAARQRARAIEPEKVRPGVVALAALAAS